jgi:hypothetical protein
VSGRELLPPPAPVPLERKPILLGPIRWVDVAGRALRRTWITRLPPAICRGACTYGYVEGGFSSPSPTACRALASSLELARPARTQCLVGTTAPACHRSFRSRSSRRQLAREESATERNNFNAMSSPSEYITRAKNTCLLPATCLYSLIGLVPATNTYGNVFASNKYAYHERRSRAISFGRDISLRIPWEGQLKAQDWSQWAIAQETGLHPQTVAIYRHPLGSFPNVLLTLPRGRVIGPYLDYVQQRWKQGKHNRRLLFEEIRAQGYSAGLTEVYIAIQPLRMHGPTASLARAKEVQQYPSYSRHPNPVVTVQSKTNGSRAAVCAKPAGAECIDCPHI